MLKITVSISYIVVRMIKQSISSLTISHTIDGAVAAGGDFIGITCTVAFAAGSGPGTVSTPSCDITIINDNIVEQNEVFSLSASIQNSNGQDARFTASGDSASATIIDNNGMLVVCYRLNYTHTACHSYILLFATWNV